MSLLLFAPADVYVQYAVQPSFVRSTTLHVICVSRYRLSGRSVFDTVSEKRSGSHIPEKTTFFFLFFTGDHAMYCRMCSDSSKLMSCPAQG